VLPLLSELVLLPMLPSEVPVLLALVPVEERVKRLLSVAAMSAACPFLTA
jgi:hypothetical protein